MREKFPPCLPPSRPSLRLYGGAMLKIIVTIFVLALLTCGYAVWPFLALQRFAVAIQTNDPEEIRQTVDLVSLRLGFAQQVVDTYFRKTGTRPILRAFAADPAVSIADPLILKLVTPAA